ncbi:Peptidylprolyl isomerase domain and WD repeat containing protein 1, partial [Coemansia sp. RSA 2618]
MGEENDGHERIAEKRISEADPAGLDTAPASKKQATAERVTNKAPGKQTTALDLLPNTQMYERSYMHRDVVEHVVVTQTGFVLTLSADGHVKFWKKRDKGIEFVKDFRAHLHGIGAHAVSLDGHLFATCSNDATDTTIKVFDVVNFDMIAIITAPCAPSALCWATDPLDQSACIVVADSEKPTVYTYGPYASVEPRRTIETIHRQPLALLAFNPSLQCIVSADRGGMV